MPLPSSPLPTPVLANNPLRLIAREGFVEAALTLPVNRAHLYAAGGYGLLQRVMPAAQVLADLRDGEPRGGHV